MESKSCSDSYQIRDLQDIFIFDNFEPRDSYEKEQCINKVRFINIYMVWCFSSELDSLLNFYLNVTKKCSFFWQKSALWICAITDFFVVCPGNFAILIAFQSLTKNFSSFSYKQVSVNPVQNGPFWGYSQMGRGKVYYGQWKYFG